MGIFKYVGSHGTKILRNCESKASDPREFNDPFEFCPHVETDISLAAIEKKMEDKGFLENIHKRIPYVQQKCPTFASFLESIERQKPEWIEWFLKHFSDPAKLWPDTFAEIAAKHIRVVCFSRIPDSILMWSHYADCHRGMVIEFDDATFGNNLDTVEYDLARAKYSPVFDVGGVDFLVGVTKRKAQQWSYEEEVRLLVPLHLTKEREMESGVAIRVLPVAPTTLHSVTLGCMATEGTASEVKNILSKPHFNHVRLRRMKRDLREFRLHAVDE